MARSKHKGSMAVIEAKAHELEEVVVVEESLTGNGHTDTEVSEENAKLAAEILERTETLEAFKARMMKVASWDGPELSWVVCDVKGYEGVRVAYNCENEYAISELLRTIPSKDLSNYDSYRMWSLFVRRIEWPFNVPTPTPDDPESYAVIIDQFRSLLGWMLGEGYRKAKEQYWGNFSRRSG